MKKIKYDDRLSYVIKEYEKDKKRPIDLQESEVFMLLAMQDSIRVIERILEDIAGQQVFDSIEKK